MLEPAVSPNRSASSMVAKAEPTSGQPSRRMGCVTSISHSPVRQNAYSGASTSVRSACRSVAKLPSEAGLLASMEVLGPKRVEGAEASIPLNLSGNAKDWPHRGDTHFAAGPL